MELHFFLRSAWEDEIARGELVRIPVQEVAGASQAAADLSEVGGPLARRAGVFKNCRVGCGHPRRTL